MSTVFKAKFPLGAVKDLRSYSPKDGMDMTTWAKQQAQGVAVGDIILCFDPLSAEDGGIKGIITSAVFLVFRVEADYQMCMRITDEEYSVEALDTSFTERAMDSIDRKNNFWFSVVKFKSEKRATVSESITTMHRWGRKGVRTAPAHDLPDPLAAYLRALGARVSPKAPVSVGTLAMSLVTGTPSPEIPDVVAFYEPAGNPRRPRNQAPEQKPTSQQIASVSIIESQDKPDAPAAEKPAQKSPADLLNRFKSQTEGAESVDLAASAQAAVPTAPEPQPQPQPATQNPSPELQSLPPPPPEAQTEPQAEPQTEPQAEPQAEPQTEPQAEPQTEPQAEPQTESQAEPQAEPQTEAQAEPQAPQVEVQTAESSAPVEPAPTPVQSQPNQPTTATPTASAGESAARAIAASLDLGPQTHPSAPQQQTGTEIEPGQNLAPLARELEDLAGSDGRSLSTGSVTAADIRNRLSKWSVSRDSTKKAEEMEVTAPKPAIVSHMLKQVTMATDKLERRMASFRRDLNEQLDVAKQKLNEKEQRSTTALEQLRTRLQQKMANTAAEAKTSLAESAASAVGSVEDYGLRATLQLKDIAERQKAEIDQVSADAMQIVEETITSTKDELASTVVRTEDTLRTMLTGTEQSLEQITSHCSSKLDERVDNLRSQGKLLQEGILLAMEAVCEAAKVQAHQSETSAIRRLETLADESLESLKDEVARLDRECSRQIERLSREVLMPHLQAKRHAALELAVNLQSEFTSAVRQLLNSRMTEFEPFEVSSKDHCRTALVDYRAKTTLALERHQRHLNEIVTTLERKVRTYLTEAQALADSLRDVTRVTDHVMANQDLIRTRDTLCVKFEAIGKDYALQVQNRLGTRLQSTIDESQAELQKLRETAYKGLALRRAETVQRVKESLKTAMQEIQELQYKHTGGGA